LDADAGSGMEKIRIRDKHPESGLLRSKLNLTISVQLTAFIVKCVGNFVTDRLADGAVVQVHRPVILSKRKLERTLRNLCMYGTVVYFYTKLFFTAEKFLSTLSWRNAYLFGRSCDGVGGGGRALYCV
jgi:hypothetical protein